MGFFKEKPEVPYRIPQGYKRWDTGLPICRTTWLSTSAEVWNEFLQFHDGNLSKFGAFAPNSFEQLAGLLRGNAPVLLVDREQWSPLRAALPRCDFKLVHLRTLRDYCDERCRIHAAKAAPHLHSTLIDARQVDFARDRAWAGNRSVASFGRRS